ncbi:MAG: DNA-binding response regulator [Chromatiales bacterium]|jgi:two-component system response regulator PhoP|nr:DNA-binding response regulator [Chromatiales bacterium]MDP6150973.1 response regulator transcription factor [Gammaproteobacteria bacterium]MDP7094308.1 response regulator transcription factor [Gammaproteobacteria bacterium]MDP7271918.1 response regulator transcription factor [Gammaproteobacteria bacterium]HJP04045.1 response regulator transcription factor [Gammaproteobacteria bacterium]
MRILVVEDEPALREQLLASLREAGHAVDAAGTGEEGLYMGNEYPVDVAILDLGLPDIDGLEVLSQWRDAGRTFPVLILTARGSWNEKVNGLETGADDYLVKPFHMEEVIARLKALVRRSSGVASTLLEAHSIVLDTTSQRVSLDKQEIELTAFEYKLLEYLMLHSGEVISKTQLAEHLYDEETDRDSNVLEVLVGRLRRKLDPNQTEQPIETLRGRGYRFRPDHG